MSPIFLYYLIINLFAFCTWGIDKGLASLVQATGGRRDRAGHSPVRRIPERWLFGLALAGGCWGCWLGVFLFRHKLRKPGLLWPLFGISVFHLVVLVAIVWMHIY